jgi:hypothetical protein
MSSIITVWGTLSFPAGAQRAWRARGLDGGAGGGESEYGGYFADEHETVTIEEALAAAGDAHHFVRFERRGDALDVRAALGDDYWRDGARRGGAGGDRDARGGGRRALRREARGEPGGSGVEERLAR